METEDNGKTYGNITTATSGRIYIVYLIMYITHIRARAVRSNEILNDFCVYNCQNKKFELCRVINLTVAPVERNSRRY